MDDEPKDWELEEERPPEHLQRKWDEEEGKDAQLISCTSCGKVNLGDALSCIYCDYKLPVKSGFLGLLFNTMTQSFWGNALLILFFIMIVWTLMVLF